jgi:hypothetical protein
MVDDLPFQRNLFGRIGKLRIETSKGRIRGGDPSRRFRETGGRISSTLEDFHIEEAKG